MSAPQELVEAALAASAADGCAVLAAEHTETNLRWAANSLTTNGQMQSRALTVVSTFDRAGGTSAGVVTRSVSTVEEVEDLVRASERAGRDADPADDAMPLVEPVAGADAGWAADPVTTGAEAFAEFAPELAARFERWSADDLLLYGFAEQRMSSWFVATSTGARRRADQPDGRLELNGKSADLTRSAWAGRYAADFGDVELGPLTDQLEQRLSWARRRIDLPAGRYETILPPTAVADLMVYTYWTASARDAEEGRSVFAAGGDAASDGATRIGQRLSPLPLTLRSDPAADGIECAPFEIATASHAGLQSVFDNTQPVGPVTWIEDGTLANLVRTRSWAQRTSQAPQPFVDNLILESDGATSDLDAMIASTERGLLLTCLWYIREVDPQTLLLTGLTRDGVYLIEDGQVQGAVNNFRFNESPVDLLSRTTEVGRSVPTMSREWSDDFRRTRMPPLRIADFNMSTVSPAS